MDQRLVTRSAPAWAWEIIDETLAMDERSKAFSTELRHQIGASLLSLQLACEASEAFDSEKLDRSHLVLLYEWRDMSTDGCGNPLVWRNHFSCDEGHPLVSWNDDWSCQCSNTCPHCGLELEPTYAGEATSTWIGPTDPAHRELWEMLDEAR